MREVLLNAPLPPGGVGGRVVRVKDALGILVLLKPSDPLLPGVAAFEKVRS